MRRIINNIIQTYGLTTKEKYKRPCPQIIARLMFVLHILGLIISLLLIIVNVY